VEVLVDYMEAVTKNVQNVPLLFYHIPEMTGVECKCFVYFYNFMLLGIVGVL